ncbi:unnamed protein product [Rhizopus stolonifer]
MQKLFARKLVVIENNLLDFFYFFFLISWRKIFLVPTQIHTKNSSLRDSNPELTDQELPVYIKIVNLLMSCIPPKAKAFIVRYQLLFVLLANDLLECAGYKKKHTISICPLLSTDLCGARLDSASIYAGHGVS